MRKRLTLPLLAALWVSACGQKGPLYLPGNPSEIQSIPSQQQPDDEDDNGDDQSDDDGDDGAPAQKR